MEKIKKAVIAVAGLGTRFLPATKAQPKEMLPLIDKPVIQYIVEELVSAGIELIVFVTSQNKRAIEDHFDRNFELEYRLKQKGKDKELIEVKAISELAEFVYIRQKSPKGWGDAILSAEKIIGNEPFIYTNGDEVFLFKKSPIQQIIDVYQKYRDGVLGVMEVERDQTSKYGIISGIKIDEGLYEMNGMVEKPDPQKAPSNLAYIGRVLFTPDIFPALKQTPLNNGELVGTDAIRLLLKTKPFYAKIIEGEWYDCGNKLGFIKATIDFALQNENYKKDVLNYIKQKYK